MTTMNAVARHYDRLTPEERFRLIVAAGARGDCAEADRLIGAGQRLTLQMGDYAPFCHAFNELSHLIFIELLDTAAAYLEAFLQADIPDPLETDAAEDDPEDDEAADGSDANDAEDNTDEDGDQADAEEASADAATADSAPARGPRSLAERHLDIALAGVYYFQSEFP